MRRRRGPRSGLAGAGLALATRKHGLCSAALVDVTHAGMCSGMAWNFIQMISPPLHHRAHRQERAARLQEILLKQRELGVDKLAGTQDLMAELGGHGRAPGDRGRARGRGRGPMSRRPHPGQAREEREGPSGPPTEPGSKVETAQGLAGLVGYDSDSLASGQPEERGRGEAAGSGPSAVEERYRREREQYQRQQEDFQRRRGMGGGRRGTALPGGRGGRGGRTGRGGVPSRQPPAPRLGKPSLLHKLFAKEIRLGGVIWW